MIYNASGGGASVEVEPLSVTENGTYTAEEGKAYSPVTVAVLPTNFDDIVPLIANFLDTTSFTVTDGGINSIRRCIVSF